MQLPVLELPRLVPLARERQPQANIPQTRGERERAKEVVARYVEQMRPVPPLSVEELKHHAGEVISANEFDPKYLDYIGVLISNESWREHLASVPYERRLLMLPKCLRVEDKCPAPFDEFGLLCKRCGLCTIQELQDEAERLGYAVLVAEGSALVMAIIQTGKIDAIVGVSCLNVLERAFPYMEAAAIPGVAIPLLQDDCKNTTVDLEWIWDIIHLSGEDRTRRMDLDGLRREVDGWFSSESLAELMGPASSESELIARDWLQRAGKRWRPFLTACVVKALQDDAEAPLPAGLRKIALAVECFHKASLIHDDIEDNDERRYDQQALHEQYGVAVALNVGDLLIGEGYRLIAESDAPAAAKAGMLRYAAVGHRTLCLGQGAELCWTRNPEPLASVQVLEIFRKKTAPAFEVALQLGAAYAGKLDDDLEDVLRRYSEAVGIAYQIRDDLDDLNGAEAPNDVESLRPSLPLAVAHERSKGDDKAFVGALWSRRAEGADFAARLRELIGTSGADERCRTLLESYKEEAVRSLADLENASLKGLLRRVIGKIFQVEVKGWCSEFEARNAPGGEALTEAAR
ncbi:MAG: polyprenyl synthetase family protein [Actinomycetota bacterium]